MYYETTTTTTTSSGDAAIAASMLLIMCLCTFVITIPMIVGMWKVFTKAGKPGWAAIVPIYNTYILTQIVGYPLWAFILTFVPFVNMVVMIPIYIDLAKAFKKGVGYGIGLIFLPIVFWPMLGFGDAQYAGPAADRFFKENAS